MCGDPQALIWAKKIGFGAFLGSQSCQILKITVFANLKIAILGYLEAFFGDKSKNKSCLKLKVSGRVTFLSIFEPIFAPPTVGKDT